MAQIIERVKWWIGRKLGFYIEATIQLSPEEIAPLLDNNYEMVTLAKAMDSSEEPKMKEEYRVKLKDSYTLNHALLDSLFIKYDGPQMTKHLKMPRSPHVTFYTDKLLIPLVEDTMDGHRTKKGRKT